MVENCQCLFIYFSYSRNSLYTCIMMNQQSTFVSRLAKFLRLNGEKVINGSSKLSLTTFALCQLNSLFDLVLFSRDEENVTPELLEDVKFLFDFIRKTPSLKIFHEMQTLRGGVDLSRFANLQTIELLKVPMHLVVGLDALCPQLKVLICHRSICFLKEIFGNVDPMNPTKHWKELKELNIAFNYLEGFDQSVGLLPNVTHLNASHNNLKLADEIQIMKNLTFVNLSFNSLEHIPMLCSSLKILSIRNNNIESLESLSILPFLEELDVSYNCISEHVALKPLKQLQGLKVLNLVGNPLSFHEKHRSITARYFHSAVINQGILLDGKLMNSVEVLHTLREDRCNRFYTQEETTHQTAINVIIEDTERTRSVSDRVSNICRTDAFAASNTVYNTTEENGNELETPEENLVHGVRKKRVRKRTRTKTAENDKPLKTDETNDNNLKVDHVQTKQLIEQRREKLREGWLIQVPDSLPIGSFQSSVDIPVSKSDESELHNTHETAANVASSTSPYSENSFQDKESRSPTNNSSAYAGDGSSEDISLKDADTEKNNQLKQKSEDNVVCTKVECSIQDSEIQWESEDNVVCTKVKCNIQDSKIQRESGRTAKSNTQDSQIELIKEKNIVHREAECRVQNTKINRKSDLKGYDYVDEANIYLLHVHCDKQLISTELIIEKNFIEETSAGVKTKLDLRSLKFLEFEKVQGINKQLRLQFDTVISSKQERIYLCYDEKQAKEIYDLLKPYVDARVLQDSVMDALQCLKCGSQFSKECAKTEIVTTKMLIAGTDEFANSPRVVEVPEKVPACPNCDSTLVIEAETVPLSSVPDAVDSSKEMPLPTSNVKQKDKSSSIVEVPPHKPESTAAKKTPVFFKRHYTTGAKVDNETVSATDAEPGIPASEATFAESPVILGLPDACEGQSKNSAAGDKILASTYPSMSSPVIFESAQKQPTNDESRGAHKSAETSEGRTVISYESVSLSDVFREREEYSCETFTSIDHRLKLHLEMDLFVKEEVLLACLEAGVVPLAAGSEFRGLCVISSKRVFILKLLDISCDNFNECLKEFLIFPLKNLKSVEALMGNQGFCLICGSNNKAFVFLVRDADLCNCFLSHLLGIFCDVFQDTEMGVSVMNVDEPLAQIHSKFFNCSEPHHCDDPLLLHLLGFWKNEVNDSMQPVCFIITKDNICVTSLLFKKHSTQLDRIDYTYVSLAVHKIFDLMGIKLEDDLLSAEIFFRDEDKDISSTWVVSTETKSSMFSFLCTLKGQWEEIFMVELPVNKLEEEREKRLLLSAET